MPQKSSNEVTKTEASALNKFRKDFIRISRPEIEAILPTKLSTLSSEKLSDTMTLYTAWREFTDDKLIDALSDYMLSQEKYDYESNIAMLSVNARTIREKESLVAVKPGIVSLYRKLCEHKLYYDLLQAKLESYNNCLTVISREISRRGNYNGRI